MLFDKLVRRSRYLFEAWMARAPTKIWSSAPPGLRHPIEFQIFLDLTGVEHGH